jgi:PilZ domain-containing protein
MQERRNENRLLCADLVEVIWEDDSGRHRRRAANLEDISLSGICLQVESRIEPGTPVRMSYGNGHLAGTVRYCVFRDRGYFLGIELGKSCQWSTEHFRPRHLLDPRKLVDRALRRHEADSRKVPA